MGAGASSILGVDGEELYGQGLGELPEGCVASVLQHLDPPEICRLARLNRAFRGAATADLVWGLKLPGNYRYLLEKAFENDERWGKGKVMSKKDIYACLCRPNFFDGGKKVFWLEKYKGGICMSISSKALAITGIDDRRYWNHIPSEESRFRSVAYLRQIWWFEVVGEVDFCFPAGTYSLYFRLHLGRASRRLGRRICKSEHVHGWGVKPVQFQLSTSNGQISQMQSYLGEPGNWVHYHVGNFSVGKPNMPTKVSFSMTQIDCTHTKGGLCMDSVLICPASCIPEKAFTSKLAM